MKRFSMRTKNITNTAVSGVLVAFCLGATQVAADEIVTNSANSSATEFLTFDWQANGNRREKSQIILVGDSVRPIFANYRPNGSGSSVCSISGAGFQSRCFAP